MTTSNDSDTSPREIRRRARDDPESVDLDAIAALVDGDTAAREAAADALVSIAIYAPHRFVDAAPTLAELVAADDAAVRNSATLAAGRAALSHPEALEPALPALIDALDDDRESVSHNALSAISSVAPSYPDSLSGAIASLRPHVDSDLPSIRVEALTVLAHAAPGAPDVAASLVPTLLDVLAGAYEGTDPEMLGRIGSEDVRRELVQEGNRTRLQHEEARAKATYVLIAVADAYPGVLTDEVPRLLTLLETEETVPARAGVIDVLGLVAEERPETIRPAIGRLYDVLREAEATEVRGKAAWSLGIIAEAYLDEVVDTVTPTVPTLVDLLDADEPAVRASAAGLLSYVAEVNPDVVAAASDSLIDRLDDEHSSVRGSAAIALGLVGAERAIGPLRKLEANDPDPDVREAATTAVEAMET